MADDITGDGSAGYIGVYEVPEDGPDGRTAVSVVSPIQGLANDIDAVRRQFTVGTVSRFYYYSPTFEQDPFTERTWGVRDVGLSAFTTNDAVLSSGRRILSFPCRVPQKATIDSVFFYCKPASGVRAALPEFLPKVSLVKTTLTTGVDEEAWSFEDDTVLGSFATLHAVGDDVAKQIDYTTKAWKWVLETEGGDDSLNNFEWKLYYRMTFTLFSAFDKGLGG